MRPLVLELSPPGQFGNATVHAVFGGPIFATSPDEILAATLSACSSYLEDLSGTLNLETDA